MLEQEFHLGQKKPKTSLDANEPPVLYIVGRELNLRKLPDQPSEYAEQLRPMTIMARISPEMATAAYNRL